MSQIKTESLKIWRKNYDEKLKNIDYFFYIGIIDARLNARSLRRRSGDHRSQ